MISTLRHRFVSRKLTTRPRLEVLEDRTAPATVPGIEFVNVTQTPTRSVNNTMFADIPGLTDSSFAHNPAAPVRLSAALNLQNATSNAAQVTLRSTVDGTAQTEQSVYTIQPLTNQNIFLESDYLTLTTGSHTGAVQALAQQNATLTYIAQQDLRIAGFNPIPNAGAGADFVNVTATP